MAHVALPLDASWGRDRTLRPRSPTATRVASVVGYPYRHTTLSQHSAIREEDIAYDETTICTCLELELDELVITDRRMHI